MPGAITCRIERVKSHPQRRVVVIGANGHFGRRICLRLLREPDIELIVASRATQRAEQLAHELRALAPKASIQCASLDQESKNFASDLCALAPYLVVHTAGPYQGQDYRVARACLSCASHYVDLADGRAFVTGFDTLDALAVERGVLLVTGASSVPGLSSAVVNSVRSRFKSIESIAISIAPAKRTPRGVSTMASVLSYCGRPFKVKQEGVWQQVFGWQDLRIQHYRGLGWRLSAACDVPDLSLLPQWLGNVRSVSFHAALACPIEHLALWLMAACTRLGLVPDWRRYVPMLAWLGELYRGWGPQTGAMAVAVSGISVFGEPLRVIWQLTADENHGPEIPCSPALILTRKLLDGSMTVRGAMPCINQFGLDDFAQEVRAFNISWQLLETRL